ncbi:MAG TPA: sulfurtransferase TusA family protein [Allosphingosinicella sp.]|jgi:tRNA 2-thiouridine synthesizing protein A|uniref:sulfurtransferase TusA family protein n=1 Tax=Allosphingosinicella sp. TaxID=2823234 RepID=UPI002F290EAA
MSGERLVDARGLRCPWPVLRLSRAARELGGPGRILILADDPIAPVEIAALCEEKGWRLRSDPDRPNAYQIAIDTEA